MPAPSRMIERLQALRFVAAGLVLVGHILMEMVQHRIDMGRVAALTGLPWGVGVDIFFVISGFIISHSALGRPRSLRSAGDFMVHRLVRVWPTYALFSLLMLVAVAVTPGFLAHNILNAGYVAASFLFVPWPRPDDARFFPVLGQGWTLNYEMFFYLSFAAALLLSQRWRVAALCTGGVLLIAAGTMAPLPQPLGFYADPIVGEFLLGILLSVALRRFGPRPALGMVAVVLAPVLLALFWTMPDLPRPLGLGLPALALVGGVLFLGEPGERLLGRRSLVLLGGASYALYLSHTFVVNAVLLVWIKLHLSSAALFFAVTFAAATIFSIVVYQMVERPSLRLLKRRLPARSAAAS